MLGNYHCWVSSSVFSNHNLCITNVYCKQEFESQIFFQNIVIWIPVWERKIIISQQTYPASYEFFF